MAGLFCKGLYLLNSRGGSIKRGGWMISENLINGEGKNISNKRGGWKISENQINGVAIYFSKMSFSLNKTPKKITE